MKKQINIIALNKAYVFTGAAIIYILGICWVNSIDIKPKFGDDGFSWHDLLVEANGMIADLIIFGIILSIYEIWKEKKDKIERLEEEIEDYIEWREPEAVYRNLGAIKRLLKLQKDRSKIILNKCYLDGANLREFDLQNVSLAGAILTKAHIETANLQGAILSGADLQGAYLNGANLQDANLQFSDLRGAILSQSLNIKIIPNSTNSKPWIPDIRETNLTGALLEGAKVNSSDWINSLKKWEVIGYEDIDDRYIINEDLELQPKVR